MEYESEPGDFDYDNSNEPSNDGIIDYDPGLYPVTEYDVDSEGNLDNAKIIVTYENGDIVEIGITTQGVEVAGIVDNTIVGEYPLTITYGGSTYVDGPMTVEFGDIKIYATSAVDETRVVVPSSPSTPDYSSILSYFKRKNHNVFGVKNALRL